VADKAADPGAVPAAAPQQRLHKHTLRVQKAKAEKHVCRAGQAVLLGAQKAISASKYTSRLSQLMANDICIMKQPPLLQMKTSQPR